MKLLPEWKRIVRRAYSFRLAVIGAGLAGVEMALPLFSDAFPRNVFLALSIGVTVSGAIARLIPQPKMRGEHAGD